jgi:hypothetical protein
VKALGKKRVDENEQVKETPPTSGFRAKLKTLYALLWMHVDTGVGQLPKVKEGLYILRAMILVKE